MNALILVDLQNDFTPSGALPIPEGDSIVPLINQLQQKFDLVPQQTVRVILFVLFLPLCSSLQVIHHLIHSFCALATVSSARTSDCFGRHDKFSVA